MFVLDTDHISILQYRDSPHRAPLLGRIVDAGVKNVFVTIVSFQEQSNGWNTYLLRATTSQRVIHGYSMYEDLLGFFSGAQLLSFDAMAAAHLESLPVKRTRVGLMDLRIAAITMANDMTLLTRNTVDFARIPGLKFDDWTKGID